MNIDSNNIYLTNTGNWSEALKLEEKGGESKAGNRKRFFIQIFLFVCVLFLIFMLYQRISNGFLGMIAVAGTAFTLYTVFRYLNPELGNAFKIPFSKLTDIEVDNRRVTVEFIDMAGNHQCEFLEGVDDKGIEVFLEIGNALSSK